MAVTTPASRAVLQGQGFYRIRQLAEHSGDIYKIDVGVKAIVVGPDSDFAEYTVYYYDPSQPDLINSAVLNSDQPFVGRLDSRGDVALSRTSSGGTLPPLGAEIYIAPKDLYIPGVLTQVGVNVEIFRPRIDLIVYTDDPAAIPDKRPSLIVRTPLNLVGNNSPNRIAIPIYGRRRWTMRVIRADNLGSVISVQIFGIKFLYPISDVFVSSAGTTERLMDASLVPGTSNSYVGLTWDDGRILTDGASETGGVTVPGGRYDFVQAAITVDVAGGNDPSLTVAGGIQVYLEATD